ncbi:MAG: hypothetical protein LWX52_17285 [Deltaproteobacteria bacterium]|nr:hypothetical protein [Deltaproteobacteria bacterium]
MKHLLSSAIQAGVIVAEKIGPIPPQKVEHLNLLPLFIVIIKVIPFTTLIDFI